MFLRLSGGVADTFIAVAVAVAVQVAAAIVAAQHHLPLFLRQDTHSQLL